MSVQIDPFTGQATLSSQDAEATLTCLDQQLADLDAEILATVQRRVELARLVPGSPQGADFGELGPDGAVLERMLARLGAPGQ